MTIAEQHIQKHILQLTRRFVAIESTQQNTHHLHGILALAKKELAGYFPIEEFEANGTPSLLIHNTSSHTRHFRILLNAHLDIVPGKPEQLTAVEEDGKLYGRGTYDMKSAAAAMIVVFKQIAKDVSYPLGMQLVTDEEVGGFDGTKYHIDRGLRSDFTIAGESSNMRIGYQTKGVMHLKIHAKGITSHAAYPWLGENALVKMSEVIRRIYTLYPVPENEVWATTVNIANITTSNNVYNAVPEDAVLHLDIRYVPGDDKKVLKTIKKAVSDIATVEHEFTEPAAYIESEHPDVQALQHAAADITGVLPTLENSHGSSDIRHFTRVGNSGVEFGPRGGGHHSDSEWVDIESLKEYYDILKTFLLRVDQNS